MVEVSLDGIDAQICASSQARCTPNDAYVRIDDEGFLEVPHLTFLTHMLSKMVPEYPTLSFEAILFGIPVLSRI